MIGRLKEYVKKDCSVEPFLWQLKH